MRLKYLLLSLPLVALGCSTTPLRDVGTQPKASKADQEVADRFVAHWNQNAEALQSVVCQAVDVDGVAEGQPYTLDGQLAFQEPKNFRLVCKFLGKTEADFGSNEDEVFVWMARAQPPAVYFCKRADLKHVTIPLPFHPDDLMQVLGTVPIDPEKFRFEMARGPYVTMTSTETALNGEPVIKRLVIDRTTGRASGFQVWDMYAKNPRLLAEANILDYYEDPSGVFFPRKVQLKMPEAKTNLKLSMRTRQIEINNIDKQWASSLFRRSEYANADVVDLGEEYRRRQAMLDRQIATISAEVPSREESSSIPSVTNIPSQVEPAPTEPLSDEWDLGDSGLPGPFENIAPGSYKDPARRNSLIQFGTETFER